MVLKYREVFYEQKKYWCYFPTNRNIKNLIKNTFLAIRILFKEKPDIMAFQETKMQEKQLNFNFEGITSYTAPKANDGVKYV